MWSSRYDGIFANLLVCMLCVMIRRRSNLNFFSGVSIFLQGALVESGAEVGPNSVVPPGQLVPAGELWAGNPVALVGKADTHGGARAVAEQSLAEAHKDEFLPVNTGFWQLEK